MRATLVAALAIISFAAMMEPIPLRWLAYAAGGLAVVYLGARLATAAYFQSKRQYDERQEANE